MSERTEREELRIKTTERNAAFVATEIPICIGAERYDNWRQWHGDRLLVVRFAENTSTRLSRHYFICTEAVAGWQQKRIKFQFSHLSPVTCSYFIIILFANALFAQEADGSGGPRRLRNSSPNLWVSEWNARDDRIP